ncbi:FG-GAP repeat domain-containing protein, partial [Micromonospora mangrovi]
MNQSRRTVLAHLVRAALAFVLLAAGAATAVTAVTAVPRAAHAASSIGGSITRSEVLDRARFWYDQRASLQYDNSRNSSSFYPDPQGTMYAPDCSGYVSMAWHVALGQPNESAGGYNTSQLPSISTEISFDSLRPGDLIDDVSTHAILFEAWEADHVHFSYYSFGSSPIAHVTHASRSDSSWSGHPVGDYRFFRYNNIIEDGGRVVADFDADGSSDLALYRPDPVNGSVWDVRSWTTKADLWNDHRWGGANDIPLTGDFDGDGTADMALYRRDCTNGSTWWIKSGATGTQIEGGLRWGGCKDIPTTGDVNGDGYTDLVLYRQDCTNGSTWQMYNVRLHGTIRTDLR